MTGCGTTTKVTILTMIFLPCPMAHKLALHLVGITPSLDAAQSKVYLSTAKAKMFLEWRVDIGHTTTGIVTIICLIGGTKIVGGTCYLAGAT